MFLVKRTRRSGPEHLPECTLLIALLSRSPVGNWMQSSPTLAAAETPHLKSSHWINLLLPGENYFQALQREEVHVSPFSPVQEVLHTVETRNNNGPTPTFGFSAISTEITSILQGLAVSRFS